MTRRRTVEVDVDLDDFSDDEIASEMQSRGLDYADAATVGDLAFAIEQGDQQSAHDLLERLLVGNAALIEAARIGRNRRR